GSSQEDRSVRGQDHDQARPTQEVRYEREHDYGVSRGRSRDAESHQAGRPRPFRTGPSQRPVHGDENREGEVIIIGLWVQKAPPIRLPSLARASRSRAVVTQSTVSPPILLGKTAAMAIARSLRSCARRAGNQ